MTRTRIEPLRSETTSDEPCSECAETYRRTLVVGAVVGFVISTLGLAGVVAWARAVG